MRPRLRWIPRPRVEVRPVSILAGARTGRQAAVHTPADVRPGRAPRPAVPPGRPGRSPREHFPYKSLVVHRPDSHELQSGDRSTRRSSRFRSQAEHRRGQPASGGCSATERRAGLGFRPGDGQVWRPRVPFVVRVSSRSCGDVWFRQGPDTGEREPRMPLGLVKKVAKRSIWQPPVDSRPRCLGSKVSVEATSASWVVEASLSEAAIRTSVT